LCTLKRAPVTSGPWARSGGASAGTFPASTSTWTIVRPSEDPSTVWPMTAEVSSVTDVPSRKVKTNLPGSLDFASVPTSPTVPSAGASGASATKSANDLSWLTICRSPFLSPSNGFQRYRMNKCYFTRQMTKA
jgi:hypothetical protein